MKNILIILTVAAIILIAALISWNIHWMSNFNKTVSLPPSISTERVNIETKEGALQDRKVKSDNSPALQGNSAPPAAQSEIIEKQEPPAAADLDPPDGENPAVQSQSVSADTGKGNAEDKDRIDDTPRRNAAVVKQESPKFTPENEEPLRITIGSRNKAERHYDSPPYQSDPGMTITGNAAGQHPTSTTP